MAPSPEHGTRYSYTVCGCRCDECKASQAKYMRQYHARKRIEAGTVIESKEHGPSEDLTPLTDFLKAVRRATADLVVALKEEDAADD